MCLLNHCAHLIGLTYRDDSLESLCQQDDERWDHYNVLGQVVNVIREEQSLNRLLQQQNASQNGGGISHQLQTQFKQHVLIPAMYKVR